MQLIQQAMNIFHADLSKKGNKGGLPSKPDDHRDKLTDTIHIELQFQPGRGRENNEKDSNISCVWVSTGFPENRYVSFRKLPDDDMEEHESDALDEDAVDDEEENLSYNRNKVKIKNKKGIYQQAISIHERYADRPTCLETMCLAQFASMYTFTSTIAQKAEFDAEGISLDKSNWTIFGSECLLPRYLETTTCEIIIIGNKKDTLRKEVLEYWLYGI